MPGEIPPHVPLGDKRCQHHKGVIRITERTCCGGTHTQKRAVIRCAVKGEVTVGNTACDYTCRKFSRI